ncbi:MULTISPECIES: hypothetical protein [Bradyrhizobium]|uniref:hypothetical protein n=1 Tax=Bradyrhizobium TaxID=374 RepID=UPI001BAA634C|nr:hypothetical protein [Bradyrhizobium liaoningense]MBR0988301.1 hypothetical protein [Bradyrhizobium liaoningense]
MFNTSSQRKRARARPMRIQEVPVGFAIGTAFSQNAFLLANTYQFRAHLGQLRRIVVEIVLAKI